MPKMIFKPYEPLPEGTYIFEIINCEVKESKFGRDFLSWTLRVVEDPEYQGRTLNFATPTQFGPKSKAYEFLSAAIGKKLNLETQEEIDTNDFIGKKIVGNVKVELNQSGININKFTSFISYKKFSEMLNKKMQQYKDKFNKNDNTSLNDDELEDNELKENLKNDLNNKLPQDLKNLADKTNLQRNDMEQGNIKNKLNLKGFPLNKINDSYLDDEIDDDDLEAQ